MAITTHGKPRTLYRNRGANYKKNMWHKAISSVVDYRQVPYTLFSIPRSTPTQYEMCH